MLESLGKWITNGTTVPFYARKKFNIEKEVKRAEACVCGLGQFIFYVNGKKAGDHELDPGWTNYRKYVQYVSFDITDYLLPGENVAAAEVGNGWFIKEDTCYTFKLPEFMGKNPNPYVPFGKSLILAVRLHIEYTDGSADEILADDSFRVSPAATVMSNVYGSEIIDGRLFQEGWTRPGFDDAKWNAAAVVSDQELQIGELREQTQPAIKVIQSYEGRLIHHIGDRDIYDFGQNMSGILDFTLRGKEGDIIRIYPAEKLTEDGDADQVAKNWLTVDSCITAIIGKNGVPEHFRMKFTYFAGRYVAVEKSAADIELIDLKSDAISSAWKRDGSFTCDEKRFNQIYSLVEKTVEANMVSVHTDCPTIERFAWQEPNHLMAPSIMFMKDGRKLWEKFLLDIRMEQHNAEDVFHDYDGKEFPAGDGLVPSQCPCYIPNVLPVPGMGSFYDIIGWGSTIILGTQWHYRFYGDISIIQDNYSAGMRYLAYLKTKLNADGFINHGLGDWGNPSGEFARENVETAFLYADTAALAEFAGLLGRSDDERELLIFAEKIKTNYNEKLLVYDEEKGYWCYRVFEHSDRLSMTQAAEAMPLYFGMVPESKIPDIRQAFHDLLEQEQAFVCGEIGLPYVIQTARHFGWNDLISRFILRKEHPSYYAFVLDGETTLGEYWENNPRSHCHDMMGHIIEWYYNGIAGIEPTAPAFQSVQIHPYLPDGMGSFHCIYESASGLISVEVGTENGEISLLVETAAGISCEIDPSLLEKRSTVKVIRTFSEK